MHSVRLDPVSGICKYPLVSSGQVSTTGGTSGRGFGYGDSSVVQPVMVAPDSVSICGTPTSESRPDIMVPTSPAMQPLFENPPQLVVWRLSRNPAKNQLSESPTRLPLSSWRNLQARATTLHGENWLARVTKGKFLPFFILPTEVVDFLVEQFDQGMSYSLLNVYHFAILSIHQPCEVRPIGEHPLVPRVLSGAFTSCLHSLNTRLFGTLKSFYIIYGNYRTMSSSHWGDLTRKLAILLALVSANRSSELAKLSPPTVRSCLTRLCIFQQTCKQDCPSHKRTAFIVPSFEGDALICPFQCLKGYIRRTSPLHTESEEGPLFIPFVKPHKPVLSASLAQWLKSVLSSAEIKGFTAHST